MSEQPQILYMEDNEGTARLLQKRLSRAGYRIDTAPNGEAGLEQCAVQPYDAIIVDYNMPGMNGIQVIQHLAERGTLPPTIMLTGTGNERIAVDALKLGASDYVIKDIDGVYLDLLPTVIDQALKNRQYLEDKRRVERALYESEEHFRSVVEQALDGIMLIDQDGKITEWNHAEEQITGVRREEALGQYIWDLTYRMMPPERQLEMPQQLLRSVFEELLKSPQSSWLDRLFEYEMMQADGERRTIQAARFPINLGDRLLVAEMARDITERKQMEDALRESEERFRMLFQEAPDPYFVNDLTGNLIDCNRAVESLLGVSRSELIGKNFAEMGLFTPDQLMKIAEILANMPKGVASRSAELTVTRPDGQVVVVDLNMIPIQRNRQTQILGIGHDITWRKQAEAQMKVHIEQLETLHHIDDELTRKLDIQYVQTMSLDNMLRLSGANAGSIVIINESDIENVQSIGYPEELNQHYSLDHRSIVARVARRREAEWVQDVTSDPDYFAVLDDTCSQITIPLVSQDRLMGIVSLETNHPEYFNAEIFEFLKLIAARVAIAIDNAWLYDTSQKQFVELQYLYEQVSKLEQLKTDMIQIVSHDLRNPLSVIKTSMYLLERSLESAIAENQQRYVTQIRQSIDRMNALTTDVLSVESIERLGRGEINRTKVDLQEIIEELVESTRTQAEQKKQALSFSTPDLPIIVSGSKTEFQQAASNLISNAIKYTPERGKIDVVLKRVENRVHFEVADTGYGIPEADQATLFQAFERVKTEETRSIEGTGLGLYIVKKIVERHSGEVIFHSEYGKGSTFGFVLPIALE